MSVSPRARVALSAGLLVFATRAWLAQVWGSPLPFWDEWGAEPPLYRAWLDGTLSWRQLVAPHNEHRIVLTRLTDLMFFILEGEWNVWSQIIFNAGVHAAAAAALVSMFWNAQSRNSRLGLTAGVVVLFCAPSGWQNALFGFQSQVYYTSLLAVAACAGMIPAEPLSRRWWLGWSAAFLALFSNGAGGLIAPVVLVASLPFGAESFWRRRSVLAWALLAALLVTALALHVSPPGHAPFRAHTARQFFGTLGHQLSWPHLPSARLWLLLQLPLILLCIQRWRRRQPMDAAERCALALFGFALLHAAAIAYSRGAGLRGFQPLSRYQDPLLLGAVAQLFAGLRLAQLQGRAGRLLLIGWAAAMMFGLLNLSETHLTLNLPYKRAMDRNNLAAIHDFLAASPDLRPIHEPRLGGLYPEPAEVRRVLEDPMLQPKLHPALKTPLSVDALLPPWIIRHGRSLTVAAAVLLLMVVARNYRRGIPSRLGNVM